MLIILNKLELVRELRKIAEHQGCHLTLRAASAIADWLKAVVKSTEPREK